MTLVITTVSKYGISLVGDRAWIRIDDPTTQQEEGRTKIHFLPGPRVGLAFWGVTEQVGVTHFSATLERFIKEFEHHQSPLEQLGRELGARLATEVIDHANTGKSLGKLRCGVHLAGYVDDLPHLYHVHMGPSIDDVYYPQLHSDWPYVHCPGGLEEYRDELGKGYSFSLFNGQHESYRRVREPVRKLVTQLTTPSLLHNRGGDAQAPASS